MLLTGTRDDQYGRVGITGTPVNIGARLKASAGVNGIPVNKKTFQAIERFFRTEALPLIEIKSRDQVITPYRSPSEVSAAPVI